MARALDVATPLGPNVFVLVGFTGRDALSSLGEFSLRLKCKSPDLGGAKMLGQNVTVRLELPQRESRYFNGYVTRWSGVTEVVDSLDGRNRTKAYVYEATVHPWLWFLTRQSNSRIFQNKTVPKIVQAVFEKHGGVASFEDRTKGPFPVREFCCQYRETDFNFVTRLMEQEGIYWFFEHRNGKHTLVLVNSSDTHQPVKGYEKVQFDEQAAGGTETITSWLMQQEIQPGRYSVKDYNPLTPRAELAALAQKPVEHPYGTYEFFDYPAGHAKAADADFYARIRLDELHTRHQVFQGGGNVRGLHAGSVFTLAQHPVAAHNGKHLVVSSSYAASGNAESSGTDTGFTFRTQVTCVPFRQQFRPARVTPKPQVQGPQTAVVVGPAGDEIHTDEHGRVKVQFRWDRYGAADGESSCWLRVMQPWAGNGYGAFALPRVGQEVVVQFLEGDPDAPIVAGSVYNAQNRPPYSLPAEKTRWGLKSRSSKGGGAANFNELRFEDKKGAEEVYVHAERDTVAYTKRRRTEYVGEESHLQVKANVMQKFDADVHTTVKGDHMQKLGGGWHLDTGDEWQVKSAAKGALQTATELHVKAGVTLVLEAGTKLSLKVGGNFIDISPAGIAIKGTLVLVNSGGSPATGNGASPKPPRNAAKAPGSKGGTDAPMSQKAAALKAARDASTPFCEVCASA